MTTPRHRGSRLVDKTPNLIREIQSLRRQVETTRDKTRPETLTFVPSAATAWPACTSATMVSMVKTLVYRSGRIVYAVVGCGTGAGSVMEVQLTCPDLGVTGPAVQTASGGTERDVQVQLVMPTAWVSGDAHMVIVQGRRVSGADATTLQVLRAWQR